MRARSALATLFGVTAAVAAGVPAAAYAELSTPQLLTSSPLEQSDGVSGAVLSSDGRYLVFTGSIGGVKGVLRRDLALGTIEPVAAGDAYVPTPLTDSARDPSVSADGRFVSFTTHAALDPDDDVNGDDDVYVRDMDASVPADGASCPAGGAPCAYTLVSAVDGGTAGLTYATAGTGSTATPRQAISADGRRVAFVVNPASDLAGPGTPGGQVAVRDLDTRRTTLVTVSRDPATGAMTDRPVPGRAVTGDIPGQPPGGAAISADGTTVAWSGQRIAEQAPTVAGDPANTTGLYNEPLWRRVADGPSAPTRRVAGAGDPEASGCPSGGALSDPRCQGPYPDLGANSKEDLGLQGGWVSHPMWDGVTVPSLSADGRTVAFLGATPLPPDAEANADYDAFVVDMRPGLTRREAVRRLTQDLHGAALTDLALAPDGRRLAFATVRTAFALTPPYLIGTPPPRLANLPELWLVDLDGQTLQRISRTVDAGPSSNGQVGQIPAATPSSPSFDATGRELAWVSSAGNLVPVDRNGAGDAFLVTDRTVAAGAPGRVDITAPPAAPRATRAWTLALRAVAQRDGTVRFDAEVPGAGVLRVTVSATVPVAKRVKVKTRTGRRTVTRRVLSKRQIAVASTVARGAGLSRLTVRVTKAYKSLVKGKAGIDATAKVTFAAASRTTLRDSVAVRFRVTKTTTKGKAKR